jgi:hypothetical protein
MNKRSYARAELAQQSQPKEILIIKHPTKFQTSQIYVAEIAGPAQNVVT